MNVGQQNKNTGGHGASKDIEPLTTKTVSVHSADNQPVQEPNRGRTFHRGSPAGSEAQPHGRNSGFSDVRIGS